MKKHELITSWDDGHILDLKLAELLKKYELTGTFYIVVDRVGTDDYLNWDQIKELDKQGFEIGSHTMTHPSDLKALFDEQLHFEIQNSKDILENVLGHTISKFCYPRGRFDDRVKQFVGEAGYLEARTTRVGFFQSDFSLEKQTTVHVYNRKEYEGKDWLIYAKEQYDKISLLKMPNPEFHLWGHSWEIEKYQEWSRLEEFFKYVT